MKRKQGFTLVEVVVVIAVVALLSAIIVPLIGKQIDDAKIGRAKNECLVIAAAIGQFYKDVGQWPAASYDGTTLTPHDVKGLVSGTSVDADVTGNADDDAQALLYGYTSTGNDDWYDAGQTAIDTDVDIFDNHLNDNNPDGDGAGYATTGNGKWGGPYLNPLGLDPWGRPYTCNIVAAYTGSDTQCVVFSAGLDGAIDTTYVAGKGLVSTTASPTDDDVWAVVHLRP